MYLIQKQHFIMQKLLCKIMFNLFLKKTAGIVRTITQAHASVFKTIIVTRYCLKNVMSLRFV